MSLDSTSHLKGKGKCDMHGPYIWEYRDGICITEHLKKEQSIKFPTPCTRNRKGPRDRDLTEIMGGGF